MRITVQLHGSATATSGEATYTARGNSHDPIPPLVRRLIAEEVIDGNDVVTVARGGRHLLQAVPRHPLGRDRCY